MWLKNSCSYLEKRKAQNFISIQYTFNIKDSLMLFADSSWKKQYCLSLVVSIYISHLCTLSNWQGTLEFYLSTAVPISISKGSFPKWFLPSANELLETGPHYDFHGLKALASLWVPSSIKKKNVENHSLWLLILRRIYNII